MPTNYVNLELGGVPGMPIYYDDLLHTFWSIYTMVPYNKRMWQLGGVRQVPISYVEMVPYIKRLTKSCNFGDSPQVPTCARLGPRYNNSFIPTISQSMNKSNAACSKWYVSTRTKGMTKIHYLIFSIKLLCSLADTLAYRHYPKLPPPTSPPS